MEGGSLREEAGGWKLRLPTDPDLFVSVRLTKPNRKPTCPKQDRGCARQSRQLREGFPGAGFDPAHCQGNLGSDSTPRKTEPAVGQKHNGVHGGRGQIISRQPAGNACSWQPRLGWRDNGAGESWGPGYPQAESALSPLAGGGPGWWEVKREAAQQQVGAGQ